MEQKHTPFENIVIINKIFMQMQYYICETLLKIPLSCYTFLLEIELHINK